MDFNAQGLLRDVATPQPEPSYRLSSSSISATGGAQSRESIDSAGFSYTTADRNGQFWSRQQDPRQLDAKSNQSPNRRTSRTYDCAVQEGHLSLLSGTLHIPAASPPAEPPKNHAIQESLDSKPGPTTFINFMSAPTDDKMVCHRNKTRIRSSRDKARSIHAWLFSGLKPFSFCLLRRRDLLETSGTCKKLFRSDVISSLPSSLAVRIRSVKSMNTDVIPRSSNICPKKVIARRSLCSGKSPRTKTLKVDPSVIRLKRLGGPNTEKLSVSAICWLMLSNILLNFIRGLMRLWIEESLDIYKVRWKYELRLTPADNLLARSKTSSLANLRLLLPQSHIRLFSQGQQSFLRVVQIRVWERARGRSASPSAYLDT